MPTQEMTQKLEELKTLRRKGQWPEAEELAENLGKELPNLLERTLTDSELGDALALLKEKTLLYEQSGKNNKLWLDNLGLMLKIQKRHSMPLNEQSRTLWKTHLCAKRIDYVAYHLQGEPFFHEALALFKDPSTFTDPAYLNLLGWYTAFRTGEPAKGQNLLETALERYSQIKHERLEDMAFTFQLLSLAYDETGNADKLRLSLERGRALTQAMKEPAELADLLTFAAARQSVEPEFALEGAHWIEKNFGDRHPKLLLLRTALAGRLESEGMDEAQSYWIKSIEKCDDPPIGHAVYALTGYGGFLERQNKFDKAEAIYRQALAIIDSNFQPEPLIILGTQPALALAELLSNQGRLEDAAQTLKDFIAHQEKDDYISALDVEYALECLISVLNKLGRSHEAEPLMRKLNLLQSNDL